jgi:acetyl-CoA C-acetyltransferase
MDISKFAEPEIEQPVRPRREGSYPVPVIVSAARTAMGKFQGALTEVPAPQLGAWAVAEAVKRSGLDPSAVDEVILGNVVSAGLGQAPARQAALKAGLPSTVAALTVNKVCASGLKSAVLSCQAIRSGDIDTAVVGGMESMSRVPYLLDKARTGYRMGHGQLIDGVVLDGLWCAFNDFHMGITGELVAKKYGITRAEQDAFAAASHRKASAAIKAGLFNDEIVPVALPQKKGDPVIFKVDEGPREDTNEESLAKLRPAFDKEGTVTAGNAPGLNDGAAALVIMNEAKAAELGARPMARILDYYTAGLAPEWVMLTPVPAIRGLLNRLGWTMEDVDLFELNEAFSVQALAVGKILGIDWAKVNVNGGAVALGHPIGASGARILVTLLHALRQRGGKRGIAALCLGGGNGVALAVEMS